MTKSGKMIQRPPIIGIEHDKDVTSNTNKLARSGTHDAVLFNDYDEVEKIVVEPKMKEKLKGKQPMEVELAQLLPKICKLPPQFPYRLNQKAGDGKVLKVITILKELFVNILLLEVLDKMLDYAKFMKDMVTKKMTITFEPIDKLHHCNCYKFVGGSINHMPLVICGQLGLGAPELIAMRLLIADRPVKNPIGILCDELVRVDRFIFPAEFVILDCEVDFEVPIIFGRTFLATGRAW
ncbi:uncharacterized protein LOC129872440 [Solanum dulcamara]|uniref:uncharacterized protein LOC129872440 n=1 Tax=Solanum dulcamara TaxID=45834 RepID=UPI0024858B5B|nr:uncharacterized protein LOC129872440 [Solanum dulcamara]